MPRKSAAVAEKIDPELEAEVDESPEQEEDNESLGFSDSAPVSEDDAHDEDDEPSEYPGDDSDGDSAPEGDSENEAPEDDAEDYTETGEGYQVLYNRYRPHKFASVIGQEHNTKPLMDKIARDQVGHAFLFSGDRGCGKTTTARLLAMALNCETRAAADEDRYANPEKYKDIPVDPEPCGKCNVCKSVISGNSPVGIEELDAASNRSIGDIRNLIASMQLGSLARRKVYIIDEVHQLSKDAVSALLKTMEEPPNGVVIILCTTDPEKIPQTIKSRVMTYRFRTLDEPTMTGLVKKIAKKAKIKITDAEVQNVVKAGRGSPRDTLSALEALSGGSDDNEATHLNDSIVAVAEALADNQVASVLAEIARSEKNGVGAQELGTGLMTYFRDCLYALQAPSLVSVPDTEMDTLMEVARKLKSAKIVRLIKELAGATGKMSHSGDARVLLEVTLVTVVVPEANDGILGVTELLNDVLDMLEDMKREGMPVPASASALPGWKGVDPEPDEEERPAPKKSKPAPEPDPEPEGVDSEEDEPEEEPKPKSKGKKAKGKKAKQEPERDDSDDEDGDEEPAPKSKSKGSKVDPKNLPSEDELIDELLDFVAGKGRALSALLDNAAADKELGAEAWMDGDVPVITLYLVKDDKDRIRNKGDYEDVLLEWVESKGFELELKTLK